MCGWAGVSESGFYVWVRREPSATTQRRAELAVQVTEVFEASNGVYGYRKVHAVLAAKDVAVCDRVVREIMAEQGLTSCHPAPWRCLTQADGTPPAPDLVGRDFTADRPGVRLVGDITQIDTWEGPLFLSTVIDLFNREVVGYAMDDNHRAELVCAAIVMARKNRRTRRRAIFHSDRGSEGGFNWSSQHLDWEVAYGKASWMDDGVDGEVSDEVARASFASSGGGAGVLASDCDRCDQRASCSSGRGFSSCRHPLVSPWWGYASNGSCSAVRPISQFR